MTPRPGFAPRLPPWRFPVTNRQLSGPFAAYPYYPPVAESARGPLAVGNRSPFLGTVGTANSTANPFFVPLGVYPTGTPADQFLAYLPGDFGRPGRAVRPPRLLVISWGLSTGLDAPSCVALAAAATARGVTVLVVTDNQVFDSGPLVWWGPIPLVFTRGGGPDNDTVYPLTPPETWFGGDVLAIGTSLYAQIGPDPSALPNAVAANQLYYARMRARCGRFRGLYLHGSDNPTGISPAPWFAGTDWELQPVGVGSDPGSFAGPIAAAIETFFG